MHVLHQPLTWVVFMLFPDYRPSWRRQDCAGDRASKELKKASSLSQWWSLRLASTRRISFLHSQNTYSVLSTVQRVETWDQPWAEGSFSRRLWCRVCTTFGRAWLVSQDGARDWHGPEAVSLGLWSGGKSVTCARVSLRVLTWEDISQGDFCLSLSEIVLSLMCWMVC